MQCYVKLNIVISRLELHLLAPYTFVPIHKRKPRSAQYSKCKLLFSVHHLHHIISVPLFHRNLSIDSPIVHILSAFCAGFAASTAANPLWMIKTHLQLYHKMTVTECVKKIYRTSGLIGFYKGITASYVGISETVIHFVIYEAIKAKIVSIPSNIM